MHTTIMRRIGLVLVVLIVGLASDISVLAGPDTQTGPVSTPTPPSSVIAQVAVERATVFPEPDRNAEALTYLYEREQVPVFAQSRDATFLLVRVGSIYGWILRAQVDLNTDTVTLPVTDTADDLALIVASPTFTPFPSVTPTGMVQSAATATTLATATMQPAVTQTPLPPSDAETPTAEPEGVVTVSPEESGDGTATAEATVEPGSEEAEMVVLPGVSPPVEIILPENWEAVDLVVPMLGFDDEVRDIPLTVYFGELDQDIYGLIYLYWGFPNTIDWASGEYNLWADGVQILRGSLVGQTCNLGVYEQKTFPVGEFEGVGADYQASECTEENDTAGWFATLRANDLTFAFFTAIEPWDELVNYVPVFQSILDSVEFVPLEDVSEETSP